MVKMGSEATRNELLIAAAHEISERGYSGASFSSVAARIGLTKGAFAYHFPTKQALAIALMENFGEAFNRAVEQSRTLFPNDDLRTVLRALRNLESDADTDPMVAAAFTLMCDPQPPVDEITERFGWWLGRVKRFLENAETSGQLRPTVPLCDAAKFLVVSMLGLTYLSKRTLIKTGINEPLHIWLLFSAIGVVDTEGLLKQTLAKPTNSLP